ncbi:orotidine-5'-phosphate decarboxylase [Candidatus Macondimonas diazotrophica]|uniref:Orotidine 5'-phosphate decarboxylase n=1 Tax=Candidatus Macondimonas diazotrophica TaxID=2305248 RepID=A0A4Z0F9U4_9GAMM|nr:orotidine-5'-phosphate decarboxylase [Candidatus Macondimonas diazotrophica]TFZ83164.1 orotidine-5'-phosphate decarboxylase [Candidatus Macondimonas diazotrophica]HBG31568.1 orotidine-5'-phosphate decarboxylase [Gammaproteobacteria bacterium]HBG52301.1 orotidine-5'-phosphate decarboxylase [Gammaproteobacteria bacterium]
MHQEIPVDERLIFAVDLPTVTEARHFIDRLEGQVRFFKLGLELFMAGGIFELVDELRHRDARVFVDLKFFDVPATVARAVARLAERGATFATVHGNQSMMEAAAAAKGEQLKILAVTALTSLDRGDLDDLGFACDLDALVLSRARRALEAGCDGVVSSGLEVKRLRQEVDGRLVVVTPGIRPLDNRETDDQKRIVTPTEALQEGADYLVVGRPIRDAADPAKAAAAIQTEIRQALLRDAAS